LKEEQGRKQGALGEISRLLADRGVSTADVDWVTVRRELQKPSGMPVPITYINGARLMDARDETASEPGEDTHRRVAQR